MPDIEVYRKNATWNLYSMKNSGDWNYTIVTGHKSDNWTKVTMTSSNYRVVYPEAYLYREDGEAYVGLILQPRNAGKATVTLSYWKGGRRYSNKFNIMVRRYENPFTRLKVGKTSAKKGFDDYRYRHGVHPELGVDYRREVNVQELGRRTAKQWGK